MVFFNHLKLHYLFHCMRVVHCQVYKIYFWSKVAQIHILLYSPHKQFTNIGGIEETVPINIFPTKINDNENLRLN